MEEHRTGRTTRLVDEYIQRFFNEPMYTPIVVKNHDVDGKEANYKDNIELLKKIENRLKNEHGGTSWYSTINANMCPSDYYRCKYHNPIFPYGSDGKVLFNDIDKSCVIMRLNDPIIETRKKQFDIYKLRLLEITPNDDDTPGEKLRKEKSFPPSLLDMMLLGRAEGNSTRLADKYVQKYFTMKPGEFVEIVDHYGGEGEYRAHKRLCDVVCGRLEEEHGEKFYVHRGNFPRIVRVESQKN